MKFTLLFVVLLCTCVLLLPAQTATQQSAMRAAASRGDWPTVERLATQSLKADKKDRVASLLLTLSQLRQGKDKEALASAHRTIAIDSSIMQAWLMASECEAQLKHPKESISLLQAAHNRFPDSLQPTWALGMAYARSGQCADAIMPLEETMFRRPELIGVMQQLAHCYFATGQINESTQLYERIVDRDPQNTSYRLLYGESLLARGDLEMAAQQYREAITLDPKKTDAYLALTSALRAQKKAEEALLVSRQLTKIDPTEAMGWFNVGLLSLELKQPDSSVRAFKQAIALRPNYSEAFFNLALAYEEKGFREDAIQAFKRCATISPALAPDAYNTLAIIYRKEGLFADAIAAHGQAISLRDTSSIFHAARINTYFEAERCPEATTLLKTEVERFPESAELLYACARCLLRNGERAAVEAIITKLDVLSPALADQLRLMKN
ncbi:MAG: tetratricopeptide repeat protein [Ignavibacteria bacterium]|nr:tetratricopeptide repeat protein [Ignavibacteria bacterium]